jgi:intracellular sulfur oxidation DsrE/DsrF family protein
VEAEIGTLMDAQDSLSRRMLLAGGAAVATATAAHANRGDRFVDGVVILIDRNDPYVMGHTISYSANLSRHFAEKGLKLQVEVVANGSGIEVFRADKTPLRDPLAALRQMVPGIVLSMCASSKMIAEAKEHVTIQLIEGATLVPFGIGRVVELQMKGWAYIHA